MTRITPSRSLRLRLTALAALAVTVTVALATAVLVATLVSAVRANVTTTLNAYAESVAHSGTDGRWPQPLPAAPGDPAMWAQVVDSSGTVLAATANIAGQPALYTLPAGSTTPQPAPTSAGGRGDERVIAQRYVSGTTPVVVYAGGSTHLLGILTSDIQGHLLFVLPLVLLGAVAISWLLIGRTLRPVERIRAEAAEITGSGLHRRIPEPDSNDEIGRLARTLNTMLDRLQDSAVRQRRFVADASHELRTPVTAIRTSLEVGLAHPDRAPWPELATRAVNEAARLQRLVDALLLLARADDDTLLQHREQLDLGALAERVAGTAQTRIPIEIHAAEDVRVLGDPDQLTRLIRNLLDNADRHAGTQVRLTVTMDGPDAALLQVADDGPGIPVADRERVFDRFVRLQSARTRHAGEATGTGLGLSIAHDIATAHGGTITITDTDTDTATDDGSATATDDGSAQRGATFTVRLPSASSASDVAGRPSAV
ncbi:signal transduction histidine kinase [Streptacidiphilus sp. MAP12-16]|uniref:sensor histidine kinase n=1 Tax=Streptacidiphilus sp. MAP12-16 TaxID=3156300 RepID=UPI0035168F67